MKKFALVVILILLTVSALSLTGCQKIETDKFLLVWEDEFDGEELDYTKWHFDGYYVDGKKRQKQKIRFCYRLRQSVSTQTID